MKKFQSPHASVTCRPQDGFNVLLRRHGGSKRNSLLRWCQNRTQGYKVSPLLLSPLTVNTNRVMWHLVNFLGTFLLSHSTLLSVFKYDSTLPSTSVASNHFWKSFKPDSIFILMWLRLVLFFPLEATNKVFFFKKSPWGLMVLNKMKDS